jgi:hypothetical protein
MEVAPLFGFAYIIEEACLLKALTRFEPRNGKGMASLEQGMKKDY